MSIQSQLNHRPCPALAVTAARTLTGRRLKAYLNSTREIFLYKRGVPKAKRLLRLICTHLDSTVVAGSPLGTGTKEWLRFGEHAKLDTGKIAKPSVSEFYSRILNCRRLGGLV